MRSIRTISKGEQIYNTYGNLPNSDLLRRYGYVIPSSRDDIVEIPCEMIVDTISSLSKDQVRRRIDILDEEGIFEEYSSQNYRSNYYRAFEIPYSGKVPEEMYLFCVAMMAEELDTTTIPEVEKTEQLRMAVLDVLGARLAKYETSIEDDEGLLLRTDLPLRKRMAIEVRLGEKRIIRKAVDRVEAWDVPPPPKRVKT